MPAGTDTANELMALVPTRNRDSGSITSPQPNMPSDPDLVVYGPSAGERIGEHYRVVRELGRGAMGLVLLARDEQLERFVAIKLVRSDLLSRSFRERFVL